MVVRNAAQDLNVWEVSLSVESKREGSAEMAAVSPVHTQPPTPKCFPVHFVTPKIGGCLTCYCGYGGTRRGGAGRDTHPSATGHLLMSASPW